MGGNVSRGMRHNTRDGGANARNTNATAKRTAVTDTRMPARLDMLLDMPQVGKDTQAKNAWNSEDRYNRSYRR